MFELFLQTPLLILLLFYGFTCISIVNEYERSVIFRLVAWLELGAPASFLFLGPLSDK